MLRLSGSTSATKRSIADSPGALRELLEEPCADTALLVLVRDGERRLGEARVAQPHVVAHGDHVLVTVLGERPEQGAPLLPVRVEKRLHEPRIDRREAVEAQIQALLGERAEEVEQRIRVLAAGAAAASACGRPGG